MRFSFFQRGLAAALAVTTLLLVVGGAQPIVRPAAAGVGLPQIRMHGGNTVPSCASPERLMAFLRERNPRLDRRFSRIAEYYRDLGDRLRVRWDYAFLQAMLETNFLTFRRPDGRPGDVRASQNNFAGIGATGGGVPGDRFADVRTGVLAQLQHLVAYSGDRVADPVAPRTRAKQGDIIAVSRRLTRPVTFADLAGRWAADRNYARSIESLASAFRSSQCISPISIARSSGQPPATTARRVQGAVSEQKRSGSSDQDRSWPAERTIVQPLDCRVFTASYGGSRSVVIRSIRPGEIRLTVLGVKAGEEKALARAFVSQHEPSGVILEGHFETRKEALVVAHNLCSGLERHAEGPHGSQAREPTVGIAR